MTHHYQGSAHDAVQGMFVDRTHGLPGHHNGLGGEWSPCIGDGPGFKARICVQAIHGAFGYFGSTSRY
ncbi:hypothetical protein [Streptacidiphilus neutrinimicus]|uniref:hypothetical protein n=1 Tax=Streptacidiphilus neutrinimicus TaxID=105420 RepID=UPI0005A93A41|nr:hypothetical protein [Streptacidiphilus neutrinimicus]